MDIEITQTKDNPLFARKDVKFLVKHEGEATPSRTAIRQAVAAKLNAKTEGVVVDHMESAYGRGATRGVARAYASADAARKQERVHLLKRNQLFQEKKKGEKAEKKEAS